MKPENMPRADFVVSILLMCFGIWVIVHSLQMPRFQDLGANPFSVPGIVPGILGTIIFLLSLTVFIRSLRRKGHRLGINRQTLDGVVSRSQHAAHAADDGDLRHLRPGHDRSHELLPGHVCFCTGFFAAFSVRSV